MLRLHIVVLTHEIYNFLLKIVGVRDYFKLLLKNYMMVFLCLWVMVLKLMPFCIFRF